MKSNKSLMMMKISLIIVSALSLIMCDTKVAEPSSASAQNAQGQ